MSEDKDSIVEDLVSKAIEGFEDIMTPQELGSFVDQLEDCIYLSTHPIDDEEEN